MDSEKKTYNIVMENGDEHVVWCDWAEVRDAAFVMLNADQRHASPTVVAVYPLEHIWLVMQLDRK